MMLRAVVQPLLLCLVLSVLMVHGLEDVQPSACSGLVDQIQGDNVLVRINGTLMTFHVPSKPGGPFNDHAVQYLEVPNLRELNRTGETCSRNTDPTLVTLSFAGCSCALSDTSEVANGVNKTARTLTISNCPPPYSQVVTTMLISTTNVTSELFYNETMPYSSAANFSYSNPYVFHPPPLLLTDAWHLHTLHFCQKPERGGSLRPSPFAVEGTIPSSNKSLTISFFSLILPPTTPPYALSFVYVSPLALRNFSLLKNIPLPRRLCSQNGTQLCRTRNDRLFGVQFIAPIAT